MPAVTSTEATTAVVRDTSSSAAQAAIATSTVPRQATRSRIECSGGPGLFARRMASSTLMASAPPRPRASRAPPAPAGDRRPAGR